MKEIYLHDIVMVIMIIILVFSCIIMNRRRKKIQLELFRLQVLHVQSDLSPGSQTIPSGQVSITQKGDSGKKREETKKAMEKHFLADFNRIIQNNLGNEQLNIDYIAKEMNISRIQLYRKTKGLIYATVSDYILQERLKKAKILLAESQISITEVTYNVGFSSPAYFSAVFKARYATTPSEFRKKTLSLPSSGKRTYQTNCIT